MRAVSNVVSVGDYMDVMKYGPFITSDKMFSTMPGPVEWSVSQLVADGSFVVLGGEPKTTKSWAGLEVALSVASGTPCFGSEVFSTNGKQRSVACVMLEDGAPNINARVRAMATSKGIKEQELRGLPLFFNFSGGIDLFDDDSVAKFMSDLGGIDKPAVIIIDPMRNAHTGEENDSGQMIAVANNVRRIRDKTGSTVVLIHHLRKPSSSDVGSPGHALRGSGALYGAVDGLIAMFNRTATVKTPGWTNDVYVRVKAAREADPFRLNLQVKDGPDGRAKLARWSVSSIL
jgi:RecA-family ATPase